MARIKFYNKETQAWEYAESQVDVNAVISTHNEDSQAHQDIREQIANLNIETVSEIITLSQREYNNLTKADLVEKYNQGVRIIAVLDSNGDIITYTNLVPTSIDTDDTIFGEDYNRDGKKDGYKNGVRLGSNGSVSSNLQTGGATTGFIEYTFPGIIRIKGCTWLHGISESGGKHFYLFPYNADKTPKISYFSAGGYLSGTTYGAVIAYDKNTGVTTFDLSNLSAGSAIRTDFENATFIRMNVLGDGKDLILTIDEEI